MKSTSLQQRLFDRIIENYARKSDAVEEIAELLNVGRDAVYRRMRAETSLTPDELMLLAHRYNISLDRLMDSASSTILFNFNAFERQVQNFEDYLTNVHELIEGVAKLPDSHFYYASQEVPIFHYFYYPELTAFKLYVYGQSVWSLDYLATRPFSFDLLPPAHLRHIEATVEQYNRVPSVSLWNNTVVDNTIQQIEYALEVNAFAERSDALRLLDHLHDLFQHLTRMATLGKKFSPGTQPTGASADFELYHNELFHLSNTIYVKTVANRMVFTTFSNPNFLLTTDAHFCDYTEAWIQKVIGRSSGLTAQNERARMTFFNTIFRKINAARKRVEEQV